MSENPKKPGQDPTEKERFEVLLEEVRGELKTLADGNAQLNQEMKEGFRQVREEIHQRFSLVEQALKENSAAIVKNSEDIKRNSEDIKRLDLAVVKLQQDVQHLADRIDIHEKAHAAQSS